MDNNILILVGLGGLIYFYSQEEEIPQPQEIITPQPKPEEIITPKPEEIIITPQPQQQEIITPQPQETINISNNPKLWSIDNIKKLLQKYKYVIVGTAAASAFLAISGYKVYKYFNQVEEAELNKQYIIKPIDITELNELDMTFSKSQKLVNAYGSLMVLQQEVEDIGFEKTADKLVDILDEENNGFYQKKRYKDFIDFVINNYGDHLKKN